jgi:RNA polymerase primary sigma factor
MKLTKDDEYALLKLAQSGDTEAIGQVCDIYTDLVLKIAHSLTYKGAELEDLKQEGMMGIMEAINRFDFSRNFRFITFAYFWIYNKVSKYTRNNAHVVRPSSTLVNLAIGVKKYSNQYYRRFNEYPSPAHLAKHFKVKLYYMREVLSLFPADLSLDEVIDKDCDDFSNRMDYFYSKSISSTPFSSPVNEIGSWLAEIHPTHRDVLEKTFGFGQRSKNVKQIAKIYKISEKEAQKLTQEAIDSIKQVAKTS